MSTLIEKWIEHIEHSIEQAKQARQVEWQLGDEFGWVIGFQSGWRQAIQESVLEVLEVRLGEVPAHIVKPVEETTDVEVLRALLCCAALAESLEDFAGTLADLTRPDTPPIEPLLQR